MSTASTPRPGGVSGPGDDMGPDPGWTPLPDLVTRGAIRPSFVCRDGTGEPIRVAYYRREADGRLVGKVVLLAGAQGPPGHAHGGSLATVLDDAMGIGAWMAGHPVVAAEITIRFREMVPLGAVVRLEAWVDRVEGKKVRTRGQLTGPDGKPHVTGEGIFVRVGTERFRQWMEERR